MGSHVLMCCGERKELRIKKKKKRSAEKVITIPRLEDPVDEIFIQRVFSARPTMPVSRYSFASALASLCDVNENGKNRERRRKKSSGRRRCGKHAE